MTQLTARPSAPGRMDLDQTELIQIWITVKNNKTEIEVYPKRKNDTTVFHSKTPGLASPWKPRQVRWVVAGMTAGQRLVIEKKASPSNYGDDTFDGTRFVIDAPDNTINSGDTTRGPDPGKTELYWDYSITLYATTAEPMPPVAQLDPMIIIKDDP